LPELVDMLELDPHLVTTAIEGLVVQNKVSLTVHDEEGVELSKLGSLASKLGPRTHYNNIKQIGNPRNFDARLNKLVELHIINYNRGTKVISLNHDSPLLASIKRFQTNEATDEDVELLLENNLAEPTSFKLPFVSLEQ
jgi:hypothetical protein